MTKLRINRLDGAVLELAGSSLARTFFSTDSSSVGPSSYDAASAAPPTNRIATADVQALNRTMRARTSHGAWQGLIGDDAFDWLDATPPELDLVATSDDAWGDADGDRVVTAAISAVVGPGRGVSVATKMLHLKRPRLFPVLDELVAHMLGVRPTEDSRPEVRVAQATTLTLHLRKEGRANLTELRAIKDDLASAGIDRSYVRILDAILWASHPAAALQTKRTFTVEAAESGPRAVRAHVEADLGSAQPGKADWESPLSLGADHAPSAHFRSS